MSRVKNGPSVADFTKSLGLVVTGHRLLTWFGLVGFGNIQPQGGHSHSQSNLVLKVEISGITRHDCPTSGTYVSLLCSVTCKETGLLDRTSIFFDDVGMERVDTRPDHEGGFKVISHCGWDWYIAKPKSTEPLVEAVKRYVEIWRPGR